MNRIVGGHGLTTICVVCNKKSLTEKYKSYMLKIVSE